MGVYVDDTREFARPPDTEEGTRTPLGQRLRGMAEEIDVDSVQAVRDLRERR